MITTGINYDEWSHYTYDFPLGRIVIHDDGIGICRLQWEKEHHENRGIEQETELIRRAHAQLSEYFDGTRRTFDLPLRLRGTAFQKKVWKALRDIPYGQTRTYQQVAEAIGDANASRAVGMANNRNPVGIVVPCHRVIGTNGRLTGYAAGLEIKRQLLELEKAI